MASEAIKYTPTRANEANRMLSSPGVELDFNTGANGPDDSLNWVNQMRAVSPTRTLITLVALAAVVSATNLVGASSETSSPAVGRPPLSLDQVVDNLVRRNQERAQALVHAEATRVYR